MITSQVVFLGVYSLFMIDVILYFIMFFVVIVFFFFFDLFFSLFDDFRKNFIFDFWVCI